MSHRDLRKSQKKRRIFQIISLNRDSVTDLQTVLDLATSDLIKICLLNVSAILRIIKMSNAPSNAHIK